MVMIVIFVYVSNVINKRWMSLTFFFEGDTVSLFVVEGLVLFWMWFDGVEMVLNSFDIDGLVLFIGLNMVGKSMVLRLVVALAFFA